MDNRSITDIMDREKGIQIGEFFICPCVDYPDGSKSVWIEESSGEGGQFPVVALEGELRKFYDRFF